MMLLTKAIKKKLAKAWYTETKEVAVKLFTPDANCTWFLTEGEEQEDGDWRLFGLCDLGQGCPELGYVLLSQLKRVRGRYGLPVERDRYWSGDLTKARKEVGA